ncbi:MAG: GNAT family N-acetyltransferase [Chloroflexota bacterium]|nr:GNAT family N-acetyltransferase [Chloroflexota bacterium]
MTLALTPIDEDDYLSWRAASVRSYAEESVQAGYWTPEEAAARSEQTFAEGLPQGRNTTNQHILSVVDSETGDKVGVLWYSVVSSSTTPLAFIADFIIFDQYRGRGYSKQALRALEDLVRSEGIGRIALHVFAHNKVAKALYDREGYEVAKVEQAGFIMLKHLEGVPDLSGGE